MIRRLSPPEGWTSKGPEADRRSPKSMGNVPVSGVRTGCDSLSLCGAKFLNLMGLRGSCLRWVVQECLHETSRVA